MPEGVLNILVIKYDLIFLFQYGLLINMTIGKVPKVVVVVLLVLQPIF